MFTHLISRRVALAALTCIAASLVFVLSVREAPAQAASSSATQPAKPTANEFLIGYAVDEGSANSPQYKDIAEAVTRFGNNDFEAARTLLQKAKDAYPKLPPVEVMMGRLWASAGQPAAGRMELEKAVKVRKEDPEAYLFFAEAALQDRQIANSEALLLEVKPLIDSFKENLKRKRNFDIRWNAAMAAVAEAREQWEIDAKYLKALIDLNPEPAVEVAAHQRMGRAMFKQGSGWKDVGAELQKALKIEPKTTNPFITLAYLYEEDKKHTDATDMLNKAVQNYPKDLSVHVQAARLALATGETKDAQKYADAAMVIDPNSIDAKVIRGVVARFSSPPDLKKAVTLLNQARDAAPKNLEASNQLALALIESADKDDRQKALDIAELNNAATTRENRINPEVASTFAWTLYKNDRKTEAGYVLKQLISMQQISPDTAYYVGKILQDQGELDAAIQFLDAALKVPTPFAQREATTKLLADVKKEKEKKDQEKGGGSEKGTQPTSTSEKGK